MDTTQTTDPWGYLRLRLGNPPEITPVSYSLTLLLGRRTTFPGFIRRTG